MNDKTVIVYLPLKPEMAKANNLPIKLPILVQDMNNVLDLDRIDLDIIIRGLEAQCFLESDEYYESYLIYYYFEAFKRALNSGNLGESKEFLERAGKIRKDYRYHFYLGLLLREEGKIELSEIELRRAVEMNGEFYIGYYELGRLLQYQEEYDEAVTSYVKSFEKSGGQFPLPFVATIDCFISKGDYSAAMEVIENVNDQFPLYSEILLRKGVIFNETQKYSLAEATFSENIGLGEDWKNFYNRSFSRARQGKLFEAYDDLKTAFRISGNFEVLYELAISEKNMGMLEDSLSHCESYYNETVDEKALLLKARILDMMGDYDSAIETTDERFVELRNVLLIHKYLAEGKIRRDLAFEEPLNEFYYRSLQEKIARNGFSDCRLIESGRINIETLTELLTELGIEDMTYRISLFSEGLLPGETREITLPEVGLYTALISEMEFFPSQQEYLSYLMSFLVSGKGKTTAIFRTLLYLERWSLSGLPFRIEAFVDEHIEEIKDLSFDFGLKIARIIEFGGPDIDTFEEEQDVSPEEVMLAIIYSFEKGTIGELRTRDHTLNNYITRLSGTGG
ncbi:MAG: tetratricopeptide repeat protein [Kosmotogaceae bacterium]|nr:tetratricopeptide repeat protein [Kosmotogaceae bacterium]